MSHHHTAVHRRSSSQQGNALQHAKGAQLCHTSLPRIVNRSSSQKQQLRLPRARSAARTPTTASLSSQRKPATKEDRSDRAQCNTESKRKETLRPGVAVEIDGVRFAVKDALGSGSFGSVWAADSEKCGPAAVKEIVCRSQAALLTAVAESRHLRSLAKHSIGISKGQQRIPGLLAREVERTGQDRWRVRIAMTRLPGRPLSKRFALPRPPPSKSLPQLYEQLSKACDLSREMLSQLAPVMEDVSTVLFHRDANPQNILLGEDGHGRPRFSLVDFGLAVSATRWNADIASLGTGYMGISSEDIQNCNPVGHGCYWPPSVWFVFSHGVQALSACRDLRLEYQHRLDFHSLGLVAFQLLIQKLPTLPKAEDVDSSWADALLVPQLRGLQDAWQSYWEDICPLWKRLLQACDSPKKLEALREHCQQLGIYKMVRRHLRALRDAIRSVAEACDKAPRNLGLKSVSPVMKSLLLLISSGESLLIPASWWEVQKLLSEGSGPTSASESTASPRTSENSASSLSTPESMA